MDWFLALILTASVLSIHEVVASDPCSLPLVGGRCRARKPGYFYFNEANGHCEAFFYSGCGGNANRFSSLPECHESCQHRLPEAERRLETHVKSPHCLMGPLLPETEGRACMAYFPMFTFNSKTMRCERYAYGGCHGSQNLYQTHMACMSACLFGQVPSRTAGRVRAVMRGRGGASDAVIFPASQDICQMPPVNPSPISCLAFAPKWTYDARQAECVKFIYSGCHGTPNLFDSQEACQAKCPQPSAKIGEWTRPEFCRGGPVRDSPMQCAGYFPKFTYDADKGECVGYVYGGCLGTENLFDTRSDCLKTCDLPNMKPPKTIDVCGLPVDKGSCRGRKPRFAYNGENKRCEMFLYGGCEGNGNRFSSVQECVNTCGGSDPETNPVCSMVKCDQQMGDFYKAQACQPIMKAGECCPSSWDCTAWDERKVRKDECFVANSRIPNGRYFKLDDSMDELDDGCTLGCFCSEDFRGFAAPTCAAVDCMYQEPPAGAKKCRPLYEDKNQCCSSALVCDEELESLSKCHIGNQTLSHGEVMRIPEDPCMSCVCKEGFTEDKIGKDEFCHKTDCYSAFNSDRLLRGCQPVFRKSQCCPTDWVCPEDSQTPLVPPPPPPPMGGLKPIEPVPQCPEGSSLLPEAHLQPIPLPDSINNRPPKSDVCLLPQPLGPCSGFAAKWYFDTGSRQCKEFQYGGFDNRGNVFESKDHCEKTCSKFRLTDEQRQRTCEQASEEGRNLAQNFDRCRPRFTFRFNKETQKCEDFSFMGCKLNKESFRSLDECEATCLPQMPRENILAKSPTCMLPVVEGNCKSRLRRFYYDDTTGICNEFMYSGCEGNENNFKDMGSCIQTCVTEDKLSRAIKGQTLEVKGPCEQDMDVGPCKAKKPAFYFDKSTRTCRVFFYGGCQGNDNRFHTFQDCSSTCPIDMEAQRQIRQNCNLPKDEGQGRAMKRRWHFNRDTLQCEVFHYFGVGGNANNFKSFDDCLTNCVLNSLKNGGLVISGGKKTLPALIPGDEGRSLMSTSRREPNTVALPQIQNSEDAELVQANQIESQLSSVDPCLLDRKIGVCRAGIPRFFFDRETKACQQFLFGGCQGNANNFPSKSECETHCNQHMENVDAADSQPAPRVLINPLCSQPMDVGTCRALKPRFYYKQETQKCEQFFWGGCEGNQNRFRTKEECREVCSERSTTEGTEDLFEARSGLSGERPRAPKGIIFPSDTPKCVSNNETYNLGDEIKFADNQCRTCLCSTPPQLSCFEKTCPSVAFIAPEGLSCTPVMDDDGCCQTGIQCVPDTAPIQERKDVICATKICPAIAFLKPENSECREKYDEDGCCLTGYDCMPKIEDNSRDHCGQVPCNLRGYLPKPGHTCTPRFDKAGCCQIGLDCVPDEEMSSGSICATKICPTLALMKPDNSECTMTYDDDGCCITGYDCIPDEAAESRDHCAGVPCNLRGYLPKPGHMCTPRFDDAGCCQIGLDCIPDDEVLSEFVCATKVCPLIAQPDLDCTPEYDEDGCCVVSFACEGPSAMDKCRSRLCPLFGFPPLPGHTCTPRMDEEGCCQVGRDCVPDEAPEIPKCALVLCALPDFEEPANNQCEPIYDSEGCCQTGLQCVPDSAPMPEPILRIPNPQCAGKRCKLVGFLPPKDGAVCRKVMDEQGCCQVGLQCEED
eukprot:maker-scaffold1645_size32249-snap-gene-0.5 protein:Tk04259 transcript:maker-scaffold1645_size32249-snap-gene-0.5-mRNA-1 annotation:"hypothetical protein DAPPUDRAFT_304363"